MRKENFCYDQNKNRNNLTSWKGKREENIEHKLETTTVGKKQNFIYFFHTNKHVHG